MNSSYPGWLTFAAHFYPFYNTQRRLLAERKMPSTNYDMKTYLELLWLLLHNVEKINARNEYILKRVFQLAPDGDHLFKLCHDKRISRIFRKKEEMQKFFTECYLDRLSTSEDNANIGEILKKILNIPKEFRSLIKWAQIYDFLLTFAKSRVSPTDEDIEAFISIITSLHLPGEKVYAILKFLSESNSIPHQKIVLHFLRDVKFEGKWKSVQDKLNIGKSWLITRIQNELNERKVVTAYQALKELTSCQLVRKYQKVTNLLDFIRKWVFDNVDHATIIAEIGKINNIDDLQQNVQNSFLTLVKDVLRKDLSLVNKQEILNEFFNSRYSILL